MSKRSASNKQKIKKRHNNLPGNTKAKIFNIINLGPGEVARSAKWLYSQVNLLIFLVIALVLMTLAFSQAPQRRGDGAEYFQTMVSLASHGSPELREGDITEYERLRLKDAKTSWTFKMDLASGLNPYNGYFLSNSGKYYSIHFWLYSLSAVPSKWLLQAVGIDGLKALQVTNALFLVFALALVLFYSDFRNYQKWLFSAFILFSPAFWYMDWPSPEVFSFSLLVASIAFFTRKKYSLAVLCAALASTQNPPIIILALFYLIYGVAPVLRSGRYLKAIPLAAAASPFILPMIFYYINFGTPNLIYKVGAASFSVISFSRTLNFFFDLDQGMLPYIPGIFAFFIFLLFRNWRKKEWRVYEILLIIILMVLLAQTTTNWNSGAEGILRYSVWILPLLIWGSVEGADLSLKTDRLFLTAALIGQVVIVLSFPSWFFAPKDRPSVHMDTHMEHNDLARYFLDSYPYLYNPEPETFAERTLRKELPYNDNLPLLHARADGNVTKILTDYAGLEKLDRYADVDPGLLQEQKDRHRYDGGVFYINLTQGELWLKSQNKPLSMFKTEIKVDSQPEKMNVSTTYKITVNIKNTGLETWYAKGSFPIYLSYHLYHKDGNPVRFDISRAGIQHRIKPGEETTIPVKFLSPTQPGVYFVEFDLIQEGVAWFNTKGNGTAILKIEVQ